LPASLRRRLFIAVRLRAWSEWDRQVIRGVQRFAHDRPNWRLYVETGEAGSSRLLSGKLPLNGIITSILLDAAPTWKRLVRAPNLRAVAITSAVPASLSSIPRVRIDDAKVAASIGRHLLAGGFRRLAYYGIQRPGVVDARQKGLTDFAAAEGYPCDFMPASKRRGAPSLDSTARWVARLPKPIGIVTWNMSQARQLVEACSRAGVDVPEQAAVVAWDDDPIIAETLEPTISAAVLPAERLGYEAAALLDRLLDGAPAPEAPVTIEPAGILHVRQSSDVSTLKDRDAQLTLQYIREHGTGPLKVSHIASALRISRSKLEREFVRVTGQTPHQAITHVRMERAKQLLVETEWRLSKVAERCGMGTEETLRRLFQSHERMTPGAYRERFSGT
jgi:LacI family transcriptional regulator